MKHFGMALSEMVASHYGGNRSALAKEVNVSPSTIGRFCSGEVEPTLESLETICRRCDAPARRKLLLAAARDRIPEAYQPEIFADGDAETERLRAELPADLAAVIRYMASSALNDEATAGFLRKIGEWVGLAAPQARLMVAEEPGEEGERPKGGSGSAKVNYPLPPRKKRKS